MPDHPHVTEKHLNSPSLISAAKDGSRLQDQLFSQIYDELRRIARAYMRKERHGHTLQPTALVHQAYVRLTDDHRLASQDRTHFLALAARAMRHVLIDHAVARQAAKRGGGGLQVTLEDGLASTAGKAVDDVILNEALDHLAILDERQARIVELRIFAGMSFDEIAIAMGISTRTAKRDWSMGSAWLRQQLSRAV